MLVLQDKLKATKMIPGQGVTLYLTNLSQAKDEITTIGDTILDSKMVRIALKGFTKEWKPLIKGIVAREKFLDLNRLWKDFIQEDL